MSEDTNYAFRWKQLKDAEIEAQTARRALEDEMRAINYSHPLIKISTSLAKRYNLTESEFEKFSALGCFKKKYEPVERQIKKLILENPDVYARIIEHMEVKENRATFSWNDKNSEGEVVNG